MPMTKLQLFFSNTNRFFVLSAKNIPIYVIKKIDVFERIFDEDKNEIKSFSMHSANKVAWQRVPTDREDSPSRRGVPHIFSFQVVEKPLLARGGFHRSFLGRKDNKKKIFRWLLTSDRNVSFLWRLVTSVNDSVTKNGQFFWLKKKLKEIHFKSLEVNEPLLRNWGVGGWNQTWIIRLWGCWKYIVAPYAERRWTLYAFYVWHSYT